MRRPLIVLSGLALLSVLGSGCGSTPKSAEERGREAVTLYREGVEQINEGKIDLGIQTLKKAKELQPDYTLLRMDLGHMLLVRAQRADIASIQLKEEAKRLHQEQKHDEARKKENEGISLNRGAMADLRESQEHLLFASAKWPHEGNIFYWLSMVSTGLGNFDDAKQNLKRAIELANPQGPELERMRRALQLLEEAELQQQRLQERK